MKKILVITYEPDLCETHTLIGVHKAGFEVSILLSSKSNKTSLLEQAGIKCKFIKFPSRFSFSSISQIRSELIAGQYDVVHCFTNRALTNTIFALRGLKTKLVTYRGTMGHLSRWSPLSWMSYLHPRIDRIVCVSNAVKDYLAAMLPEAKLIRIYKGHDQDWYAQQPKFDLSTIGIPPQSFVISCIANLRPVKGVSYLIEALRKTDSKIHLLLVGHIADKAVLKLLSDSELASRIHAIGYRDDAPALLASCDAFVMPSVEREGLCKAVLEAMALGIPTIITNVGGMPEVVQDGVSGLIVPPRDSGALRIAIEKLYSDSKLRHQLSENARKRIMQDFTVEKSITQAIDMYLDL